MNDLLSVPLITATAIGERQTDIAVLGAGIAGLTAAYSLSRAGQKVVVIDQAAHCGGTHRSCDIGPYTFDSGSTFFEQNHPLFSMFEGLKGHCPAIFRKQGRVVPNGEMRRYPFEPREVLTWPLGARLRFALDLTCQRLAIRDPKDAEAFCLARIGRTAYEISGLRNYVTRFHQEDPAQIDVLFCQKRMHFVLKHSRLFVVAWAALRLLAGQPARPKQREPLLVRPQAGFEAIYGEVRRQLEARGVTFLMNAPVERVSREEGDGFRIATPVGIVAATHVIGAIPVDTLHRMIYGVGTRLESIDLLTLFISVSAIPGFDGNVLFNFHGRGRWKRATIYSRIYGKAAGREYFAVEITQRKGESKDATAAFQSFRRDIAGFGVFAEDLQLEGYDVVEDAYPLYRRGCGRTVEDAIARLTAFGIVPVGRQGRFEYLPVSAQVIAQTQTDLETAGFGEAAAATRSSLAHLDL